MFFLDLFFNIFQNEKATNYLTNEIKDVLFGSTTTDCWVSNSNNAYMVVTFHYIDKNIELVSRVLSLEYLDEDHNTVYLKSKLTFVMTKWNTLEKVNILQLKKF